MDYSFMADECRMIFFTSCEESQMNERVGESLKQVNKNCTSEPTMKLVFVLSPEILQRFTFKLSIQNQCKTND